jgi:hypothetical protein
VLRADESEQEEESHLVTLNEVLSARFKRVKAFLTVIIKGMENYYAYKKRRRSKEEKN